MERGILSNIDLGGEMFGIGDPRSLLFGLNLKRVYPTYFKWIDEHIKYSVARGYFETKFGWRYYISDTESVNPRRLMNWPLQSHGSEILRRAIVDLDDEGFEISMPVHDAVLIHMDRKGAREKIKKIKSIMSEAAKKVIGAPIGVDVNLIGKSYEQSGDDKERWNKLHEKLIKAKSGRITDTTREVD